MKVLACAVGFGLGPSGKLCSIVCGNNKYQWYACGDKLDLSIYKINPYIDYCWSKDETSLRHFIRSKEIKYAIDVLDPEMAILLTSLGVKVIYIDSLPFMWTEADMIPHNVAYYCAQKYPNFTINNMLSKVRNLKWIDPIITMPPASNNKTDNIVINFGGLHSPYGDGREYLELILKALIPLLPQDKIYIAGGQNVVELTNKLFPQIPCKTYVHEDFLELVSNSKLFITSPGLTTIYETCEMDIDTIILPPQNLSQFYNSLIAQKVCRRVKLVNWNRDNLNMNSLLKFQNCPEEETVTYIYEQIKRLSDNEYYCKHFQSNISNVFQKGYNYNNDTNFFGNGVNDILEILTQISK